MRRLTAIWVTVILTLLSGVTAAQATRSPDQGEIWASVCERAAIQVAAETGVPADILGALTLTETGRRRGGVLRPWALSVNAEGAGSWFDDPESAIRFAEDRVAQGRPNMDIGCFQINYRWHGENFSSVAAMFDPLTNTRYAAAFVAQLYQETGDWRAAAGAFHSKTPHYASRYLKRFDQLRAQLRRDGFGGMRGGPGTYNRFADAAGAGGGDDGAGDFGAGDGGGYGGDGLDAGGYGGDGYANRYGGGTSQDGWSGGGWADGDGTAPELTLAQLDALVAASVDGGGLPGEGRAPRAPREPATLLGAPLGTATAGRGSLSALAPARGPLLTSGGRVLAVAAPDTSRPMSGSTLWETAENDL